MSGKPSADGVKQARALIEKLDQIDEQLARQERIVAAGIEAQKIATALREELQTATRELLTLLETMDLTSPENWGWDRRIAWFLRELISQVRSKH